MNKLFIFIRHLRALSITNIFVLYSLYIKPRSLDDDLYRKELVCNLLLSFILLLVITLDILTLKSLIEIGPSNYNGVKPGVMFFLTGCTLCLIFFSRKGHTMAVSQILIWALVAGGFYSQATWGADLPSVILLWCFIITASSILISTRYSFFLGGIISVGIILFQALEERLILAPLSGWKNTPFRSDDAFEYAFIFILIAGVSWISNREISKSLSKVKASKIELENERDSLEIKVVHRTQELHRAQIDKINSMYQLVEFGRISSGLFHDLMTPLNTLSLVVNKIVDRKSSGTKTDYKKNEQIEEQIETCIRTSNRIAEFINLAKRQIQHIEEKVNFDISQEIYNSISLLYSKARHQGVNLKYNNRDKLYFDGSPTLFSHIITNLISNAIDAYSKSDLIETRDVLVYARKDNGHIEIEIRDFGCGIPSEIQTKIFDPFFTTKSVHGCGIGLSATKHTLEKYFCGQISFVSNTSLQTGTTFTVRIPM